MTFTEIVDRIAEKLGIPSTSTQSIARIGRQVNDVYREVTTSIGLDLSRRSVGVVGTTSAGARTVTFSGIEKIERIYDDTSGSVRPLIHVTFEQMAGINPAATDTARKWTEESWTATSVVVRLDILPQTEFDLKADGYATVSTLSGSDVPAFPVSFHDILIDGVLAEEYIKLEKAGLADRSIQRFEKRLSDLRMWRAKSIGENIRQSETRQSMFGGVASGGGGGGSAPSGGTSWTQTGLITFDRDPNPPFAVTSGSAMVANLDAEFLGGLDASAFAQLPINLTTDVTGDLPFSNVAQIATDRLLGRDTAGTGDIETLTVGGGVEFTGSGGIQRSALTGDVTASAGSNVTTIPNDTVTYAKMQNVSAASRLLGRGDGGAGDPQEIVLGTGLSMSGTTLNGVSTTKPFIVFSPLANEPPASAYATRDVRNSHPVLDFDGATDEEAVFGGVLPVGYAGGGLTVELWVLATSATTGTSRWQAAFERIQADTLDIDADSFAAFQSSGEPTDATSGVPTVVTITFTDGAQMDSLAAGEAFRLKIRRDADGTSGTDDIATDMELLRVVVRET